MATGTVRLFNADRGFGFIAPDDGSPDLFVHISAVKLSGLDGLTVGDQVSFEETQDHRLGKLRAVAIQVLADAPAGSRTHRTGDRPQAPRGNVSVGAHSGTVKWFNAEKGYGFVVPSDGSEDVFVHKSALVGSELIALSDGARVFYDVEDSARTGKMVATNLSLASE